ncbi:MAG: hypothetical protein EXS55_01435 [Candidatus Magasanikbacteria bacterium]|nr:hypothetical protein [Candidatus Magasanikbacteria bacterium]
MRGEKWMRGALAALAIGGAELPAHAKADSATVDIKDAADVLENEEKVSALKALQELLKFWEKQKFQLEEHAKLHFEELLKNEKNQKKRELYIEILKQLDVLAAWQSNQRDLDSEVLDEDSTNIGVLKKMITYFERRKESSHDTSFKSNKATNSLGNRKK